MLRMHGRRSDKVLLMRTVSPAVKLALSAMSTALGVLALYVASLLGTSRLALMFAASLMIWIPLKEKTGLLYGFLTYLATAALTYLLVPDKLYVGAYIFFFGLYGFIQLGFDSLTKLRAVSFLLKFLCCNLIAGLALGIGSLFFDLDIALASMPGSFPLWAIIAICEAAFIAYVLLYAFCTRVFDKELRKLIVKRD